MEIIMFNSGLSQPEDKGILLKDIIERDCLDVNSEGWHKWWEGKKEFQIKKKYSAICNDGSTDKAICMTARQYASWNGNFININNYSGRSKENILKNSKTINQKSVALCGNSNITGSGVTPIDIGDNCHYRKLTPRECFRLQTVPEHHIDTLLSAGISNTQLYKMAGNAWNMKTISHIFKSINNQA